MLNSYYMAAMLAAAAYASKYSGEGGIVKDDGDMPLTETILTYEFTKTGKTVETINTT